MRHDVKLSICVPTFNRAGHLRGFFESIDASFADRIELVILDDGSTDLTSETVKAFESSGPFPITYRWQENAGRGPALREAVRLARHDYILIMDSDDRFTPDGIRIVFSALEELPPDVPGAVFNTETFAGSLIGTELPRDGMRTNLIALRADLGVRGDKKEVLKTDVVRGAYDTLEKLERRVPTSLLWSTIAEKHDCICVNRAVAQKNYLPGGLSDSIERLKLESPHGMSQLNELLFFSARYRSLRYRIKAGIQYVRYTLRTRRPLRLRPSLVALFPVGAALSIFDLLRLGVFDRLRRTALDRIHARGRAAS